MMTWLRMSIKRSLTDRQGASAVELAFALPVLIAVLVGAFELGAIMLTEMLMEGAIRDASRMGMTGNTPTGQTREEMILGAIDNSTLNFVDTNKAVIRQLVYDNFSDIGKPEPFTDENNNDSYDAGEPFVDINGNGQWDSDMGAVGLGGPGDVVVYTVTYDLPSITGVFSSLYGEDGTIRLTASTAIRNEPFGNNSGGGGGGG